MSILRHTRHPIYQYDMCETYMYRHIVDIYIFG